MSADLMTFGYFEHVVLVLGWVVNNAIWGMLNESMVAALPFVALVLREWYQARREGEDEGNKGLLTLNRIEAGFYAMILIYGFCTAPIMTINFQTGQYDETHWKQCGTKVYDSTTGGGSGSIGGQTAKAPLWWAAVHAVSHGATNAAVAALPCTPDYQYIATTLDGTEIADPTLRHQLNEFQKWCYGLAKHKLLREATANGLPQDLVIDVDWIGSSYFLNTSGYYDSLHADKPTQGFPYDSTRDAGRSGTGPGQPGYPTCKEWWEAGSVGLKARLASQVETDTWDMVRATFSSGDAEDAALRRVLAANPRGSQSPIGGAGSAGSSITEGYGSDWAMEKINGLVQGLGLGLASMAAAPMKGIMVDALPMVQWLTVMAIIMVLPFLLVFSGYSWKVTGLVTFLMFGTIFMTFWWQLATWMDNNLTEILYGNDMDGWLSGIGNAKERMVRWFVVIAMYLVLPALWMGMLGWAGYKGGQHASAAIEGGQKPASDAGQKGGDKAKSIGTKGKL
ncbi:conjugal transfer protein TraG N-terminal domain-containing protein [Alloalcanivorax xenomutans]|uniref:conjugal transfer protein TraG N-terminal domain-containing protein n=1 Tax=Alloalcanivorax xenomutans TaxID=1094342 RepID=UPI000C0F7CF9|nr:conjugal transfer protein TraG N-terminal domain-containing protein [Alloalcanivorax xenomutans]MCE7525751.1 conjugal transfer protein TraG N-terminal domain-containing protein [Alloalcanivorax xenomutans]PHS67232.1 MAG: hypothetical protein COB00_09115 [Alcanivorax sp.]